MVADAAAVVIAPQIHLAHTLDAVSYGLLPLDAVLHREAFHYAAARPADERRLDVRESLRYILSETVAHKCLLRKQGDVVYEQLALAVEFHHQFGLVVGGAALYNSIILVPFAVLVEVEGLREDFLAVLAYDGGFHVSVVCGCGAGVEREVVFVSADHIEAGVSFVGDFSAAALDVQPEVVGVALAYRVGAHDVHRCRR